MSINAGMNGLALLRHEAMGLGLLLEAFEVEAGAMDNTKVPLALREGAPQAAAVPSTQTWTQLCMLGLDFALLPYLLLQMPLVFRLAVFSPGNSAFLWQCEACYC